MPLQSPGAAPYAPPAAVMEVINGYRERGLTTPFNADVLMKAGVSESLVPRTLRSLEVLELIDKDGKPTPQFDLLRRATSEEFKPRLAEFIRGVYAEVFQFTDPVKDTPERVADAFRAYDPIGQRGRMVSLFLGLCEAAGIVTPGARRASAATSPSRSAAPSRLNGSPKRKPDAPRRENTTVITGHIRTANNDNGIPPALLGVLNGLPSPEQGWTREQRENFYKAFGSLLDFSIPIRESAPAPATVADADDDPE